VECGWAEARLLSPFEQVVFTAELIVGPVDRDRTHPAEP
jgi:hypothetical protein